MTSDGEIVDATIVALPSITVTLITIDLTCVIR